MSAEQDTRADSSAETAQVGSPPPGGARDVDSAPTAAPRHQTADPGSAAFDVRGVRSPLVGRERELAQMIEVIERAIDFQAPQLITMIGNQGTGKTRLVSELAAQIDKTRTRIFAGRATKGGPRYGVIGNLLRSRFRIIESKPDDEVIAEFRSDVQRVFADDRIVEMLHFLGGFVDLSLPDSPFLRVLTEHPEQHDEISRTVLRRFLEVDAHASPLVLVFDSLHWADAASLHLLRELSSSLSGAPVVMIVCARPEMLVRCAEWGRGAVDHLRIDLRNLEGADAETLLRNLLFRCDVVPPEIIDDAVAMTGGNPYFLEQLVQLFLANGTIQVRGDRWHLDAARAAETELPLSIEEAIEARIAALEAPERDLLEKGAVFGNVFWIGAVVAITRIEQASEREGEGEDDAHRSPPVDSLAYCWSENDEPVRREMMVVISNLVERDYLLKLDAEDSTIPGDIEVVFKHNLERELVVKSTEPTRLARYHRLAAQWLEAALSDRSGEQLEFLAQLYEHGGDYRRAAYCYIAGGDRARSRYANDEAVHLYRRGLAMLEPTDALARLIALHNLGDVLELVGRTDEAGERFGEMLRLSWLFDNHCKAGAAHSRLGRICRRRGAYDRAMQHLRLAHDLFERAEDRRGLAAALDDIGRIYWLRGVYAEALEYYRRALETRRTVGDRRSIALSLANIGRVHHDSGEFKAAIDHFREALDLRRDIGDMSGVVLSLCDLGGVHSEDGRYDMALQLFEEAHKIARDIGDRIAQNDVLSRMGECKSAMGRAEEAVHHLREAVHLATQLGDRVALSECHRRLAEVYLHCGDPAEAHQEARRALKISEDVGSLVHAGTSHRVLAEAVAATRGDEAGRRRAAEHFERAVEILANLRNELELARCYRAYAIFEEQGGRREHAFKLRQQADEIFGRLRGAASLRLNTSPDAP